MSEELELARSNLKSEIHLATQDLSWLNVKSPYVTSIHDKHIKFVACLFCDEYKPLIMDVYETLSIPEFHKINYELREQGFVSTFLNVNQPPDAVKRNVRETIEEWFPSRFSVSG